ncbi:MAG: hypothetical protein ABI760_08595 [Ferruginibacter sp.]
MATGRKILNDKDYKEVMVQIDTLMAKGSRTVTKNELAKIHTLSLAAQLFEQNKYEIEEPTTLAGII